MPPGPGTGKCQTAAGILDDQENLTPGARKKFVDDVKAKLAGLDTFAIDVPCFPALAQTDFADLPLEDEKLFPQFHSSWVDGVYRSIAQTLNVPSNFTLLPICDILAFGFKLNLALPQLSLPDLLVYLAIPSPDFLLDLGIKIPDLPSYVLKFPDLIQIPKLPIPKLPPLPPFQVPMPAFEFFLKLILELPKLMIDLCLQIPQLLLKLPFDFLGDVCKLIGKAIPPPAPLGKPDPNAVELSVVQIAAAQVVAEKTVECMSIAVVGSTLGASPAGIVGNMGAAYGYKPVPPAGPKKQETSAQKIVKSAKGAAGLSYPDKTIVTKVEGPDGKSQQKFEKISTRNKYLQFILPTDTAAFRNGTGGTLSSCGLFARALLYFAGSKRDEFVLPYQQLKAAAPGGGPAVTDLLKVARQLGKIPYDLSDGVKPAQKPPLGFFEKLDPGTRALAVFVGGSGQYEQEFGGPEHVFVVTSTVSDPDDKVGIKRPSGKTGPLYLGTEGGQGTQASGYAIGTALYGFYLDGNGYAWATRWFRSDQKDIVAADASAPGDPSEPIDVASIESTKYAQAESRKVRAVVDLAGILDATK